MTDLDFLLWLIPVFAIGVAIGLKWYTHHGLRKVS